MATSKRNFGDLYVAKSRTSTGTDLYYVLLMQTYAGSHYWHAVQLPTPTYTGRVIGYFKPSARNIALVDTWASHQ